MLVHLVSATPEHSSNGTRGGGGGGFCSSAYNSLSFHARHLILVLKDRGQLSYFETIVTLTIFLKIFPKSQKSNFTADSEEPKKVKVAGFGPNFMEWVFI